MIAPVTTAEKEKEKKEKEKKEKEKEKKEKEKEKEKKKEKKKGRWLQKIPKEFLITPGGVTLLVLSFIIEIIDWIPLPFVDQIIEIPLEIIFWFYFIIITGYSLANILIPFFLERITFFNDIFPTLVIRLFI